MSKRKQQPIPELWGATEVAQFLGILRPNLYKVVGLPEPALELERGRLWRADEIREFSEAKKAKAHAA